MFQAIVSFMRDARLLKIINNTAITLIPKVANPKGIDDFRPISLCNLVYRFIAKLLANRLKTAGFGWRK